jgi:hypothetical protein
MNHFFNVEHAKRYGVIEAVLIANFQFWIAKNKANGENLRNGRTWTYNSVRAYALLFPYLSRDQVRRTIDRLVAAKVLMVGNYNDKATDQTKWFAFCDEGLFLPDMSLTPDLAELPNAVGKSAGPVGNSANSLISTDVNTHVNLEHARVARAKKGTRLTDEWLLPKRFGEWALTHYPEWTPEFVRERGAKFRDHWSAVPGKAGLKTNWFGTWRNFCLAEAEFIARVTRTAETPGSGAGMAWLFSDTLALAEGAKRGLQPNPGESMSAFKGRIRLAVEAEGRSNLVGQSDVASIAVVASGAPAKAEAVELTPDAIAARRAEIGRALEAARRGATRT